MQSCQRFIELVQFTPLLACTVVLAAPEARAAGMAPFNACTAYAPPFVLQSFAGGAPFAGCAAWSAVRGRNGCIKTKGPCPACIHYPGDHLQMWLPEYFIEVTTAPGESAFALSADGALLASHLKTGFSYWKARTKAPPIPKTGRSMSDAVSQSNMWHARVLVMPYANFMGSFYPLPSVQGTEAPTCFAGLSEFLPDQWNFNLVDVAYAAAWAPVGIPLCTMPEGASLMGGLEAVKGAVSKVGGAGNFGGGAGEVCARPVTVAEGLAKNLRPTSDALAPLTSGPAELSSKLCMGSWGNLLPRTGWAVTADPLVSALQAAYRFTSLAADMNLNDRWKLLADDKWQVVFPTTLPGSCFKPGVPFASLLPAPVENPKQRSLHDLNPASVRKGTYVIAVWRRRSTCEEPLETVGGWSASHKVNLTKNAAACSAVNTQGGWQ